MTGLILRDRSFVAAVKSLVQISTTLRSTYDSSLGKARESIFCRSSAFCVFLQVAAETIYRRYDGVTRLVRRYPKAFQIVEKVSDEAVARDSAAERGRVCITISIVSAFAVRKPEWSGSRRDRHTAYKRVTQKKKAALLHPSLFYSYYAVLLQKLKTTHKKAFAAKE